MRRVKFMLLTIAVFALAGGALAFTATKSLHRIWTSQGGQCVEVMNLGDIHASTTHGGLASFSFTQATSQDPGTQLLCDTDIYYTAE